jgi:DNA-binding transcriptional LysR family regulator
VGHDALGAADGNVLIPGQLVAVKSAYYAVSNDAAGQRPAVGAFREWLLEEAAQSAKLLAAGSPGPGPVTGRA